MGQLCDPGAGISVAGRASTWNPYLKLNRTRTTQTQTRHVQGRRLSGTDTSLKPSTALANTTLSFWTLHRSLASPVHCPPPRGGRGSRPLRPNNHSQRRPKRNEVELKCQGGAPQNIFPLCKDFDIFKHGPSFLGPTATLLLIHFEREDLAVELLKVIQDDLLEGRSLEFFCYMPPTPHPPPTNPHNIFSTRLRERGLAHGSWPHPAAGTRGAIRGRRGAATLGKPPGGSHPELRLHPSPALVSRSDHFAFIFRPHFPEAMTQLWGSS